MHTKSALKARKTPNTNTHLKSRYATRTLLKKKMHRTIKKTGGSRFSLLFTLFRVGVLHLSALTGFRLSSLRLSLSLFLFSQSDDIEAGEMRFATRHERVPRESIILPPLSHAAFRVRCKSHRYDLALAHAHT